MKIEKFEEIQSWKKAQEMAKLLHKELLNCRDFWFKDQIERACVSISNNIAEWFERKTNNEFVLFLFIAKWSCAEVRSMLYLWRDFWYITEEIWNTLYELSVEISRLISALITSIKR